MKVEIKILNKEFYKDYYLPQYATQGSAAVDLICCEDMTIYPGQTVNISTGLAVWIGSTKVIAGMTKCTFAGLVLPRSGLGTKGLILANTIGLIDEDYQGELVVKAHNRNTQLQGGIRILPGERFAQLMFLPIVKVEWEPVEEFSNITTRACGGFGSTGA